MPSPFFIRLLAASLSSVFALSTHAASFTYQGSLQQNGRPADGAFDMNFGLYSAPSGLSLIEGPILIPNVEVVEGVFTVTLNFGDIPPDSYVQVGVRPSSSTAPFTGLMPRQRITPAPLASALTLPYRAAAGTNGPVLEVQQNGIVGGALSARIEPTNCPYPAVNARTQGIGHALQSTIHNFANPSHAVLAQTNGSGNAIYATTTGQGDAARFVVSNAVSTASAVRAVTSGDGAAVDAACTGDGYAVHAVAGGSDATIYSRHNGPSGTALQVDGKTALRIDSGALRVVGAGVNTNTCAFVHSVTAGSIHQGYISLIDHPMTNGDPNAIIMLTPRRGDVGTVAICAVRYIPTEGKWGIATWDSDGDPDTLAPGLTWNVLVFKP